MSSVSIKAGPRVLVTGATGFVGRHLLRSRGAYTVRAAVRSGAAADAAAELGAEPAVVGSIDEHTDWTPALRGIEHVVHLAARVHVMDATAADRTQYEQTNVSGTERLAGAAARAGVKRFVFVSTVKVNGEATGERAFQADDRAEPRDDYGRSKLEAERRLQEIDASSAMRVAIIRPPLVYGPGVRANFLRLLSWSERALPLPLARVNNVRSIVSVWNLCDLIWSLLMRESPTCGVFMISDGQDISTPELIRLLAHSMGRSARLFPAPIALLRIGAALAGKSEEFRRLCGSLAVDISDTRERLGWTPPVSLDEGLRRTADWYIHRRNG
jgi:nucleoside-diphosphate-sugar epimerase